MGLLKIRNLIYKYMIGIKGFTTVNIQQIINPINSPNVKRFFVADPDGDILDVYYAQATASGGEQCLRQRLEYTTTVSGVKVIQKEAWENAIWSGAPWDIE